MEIDGYDGKYLIFPNGLVFSKYKMIFLKTNICNNGYKYIKLYKNGKGKTYRIHRLIAQYFIPNPNNYPVVDHIDRNRQNNDIYNLRWVSYRQNSVNCTRKISKLGHKGIRLTIYNTYQFLFTLSKTHNTLDEAIYYRNMLYRDIGKRKPRKELTGITSTIYNTYIGRVTIHRTYKTLEEAIEGRKQMELKYYN